MRMGRFSRRLQNAGQSQYRDYDTSETRILEDPEKVSVLQENAFANTFLDGESDFNLNFRFLVPEATKNLYR